MAGTFRPRRGSGTFLDWHGFANLATAAEASRRAIDEVSELGADLARATEAWDDDTGQTRASVFVKKAIVEAGPPGNPHVWGEWGIEERPHLLEDGTPRMTTHDGVTRVLTTKDVGLFLEFGTVNMSPRSWLYPAWDATKVLLLAAIVRYYKEIAASGAATSIRNPLGRFISHSVLAGEVGAAEAKLRTMISPESV